MKINLQKPMLIVVLLIIAILSVTIAAPIAKSQETYAGTVESLDDKKATVLKLAAASTAASVAMSFIPGDAEQPIVDKITSLSTSFIIVLCALYLEKYLLTIFGAAATYIIIPAACILFIIAILLKMDVFSKMAVKTLIVGLVLLLVIPTSVLVSDMIEDTYETSISETLTNAEQITQEIEEESSGISGVMSKLSSGLKNLLDKMSDTVNQFIEAVAVMLVTTCVIPIIVVIFFLRMIRSILGIDIRLPKQLIPFRNSEEKVEEF